jgi:hypothetical protein
MTERRQFYRKPLGSAGHLVLSDKEYAFVLVDISLRGLQAEFKTDPSLQLDQTVHIRLPEQGIDGIVSVVWKRLNPDGSCFVGFSANRLDGMGDNSYWFREEI